MSNIKEKKSEFGDDTKRGLFTAMFSIRDRTSTIINSATDYTEGFDELINFLKRRLAREKYLVNEEAIANKKLVEHTTGTPDNPPQNSMTEGNTRVLRAFNNATRNIVPTRNNNYSGGWRVPKNLWRNAAPEQKILFNELKRREQEDTRANQDH